MAHYERQEKDETRHIFPIVCTKYRRQKIEWERVRKKEPIILIDRNNSDSDRAHLMENPGGKSKRFSASRISAFFKIIGTTPCKTLPRKLWNKTQAC